MDFGDNVWDVEFDPPDEWSEAAEKAGFGPCAASVSGDSSAQRSPQQSGSSIPARRRRRTTSITGRGVADRPARDTYAPFARR
jgi:hypothetical protein